MLYFLQQVHIIGTNSVFIEFYFSVTQEISFYHRVFEIFDFQYSSSNWRTK